MIRKLKSGCWRVDVQPGGRGQKRIRKTFVSKADAQRFERWALSQHPADDVVRQVRPEKRRLSELVTLWYDTPRAVPEGWRTPLPAFAQDRPELGRSRGIQDPGPGLHDVSCQAC